MRDIVVTAFEAFGGRETNVSERTLSRLEGVRKVVLPVSFLRAAQVVRALAESGAEAIVCLGEAAGRDCVSVERVAINLMDARIPDNDGFQPIDRPVRADGPAAYFATLPARGMRDAIRAAGVAAELSCTAGTYVCNSTFYALMDTLAQGGRTIPAGFLHLPTGGPDDDRLARGIGAALRCLEKR